MVNRKELMPTDHFLKLTPPLKGCMVHQPRHYAVKKFKNVKKRQNTPPPQKGSKLPLFQKTRFWDFQLLPKSSTSNGQPARVVFSPKSPPRKKKKKNRSCPRVFFAYVSCECVGGEQSGGSKKLLKLVEICAKMHYPPPRF